MDKPKRSTKAWWTKKLGRRWRRYKRRLEARRLGVTRSYGSDLADDTRRQHIRVCVMALQAARRAGAFITLALGFVLCELVDNEVHGARELQRKQHGEEAHDHL